MKILENMLRCFSDWEETAVSWRRLLHRHAQPGWLEFFATGFIAEKLESWGIEISQGTKILDAEGRLFVPPESVLDREYRRALSAGIDERYLRPARGGLTGVVGVLVGAQPGPHVAFRFDIDALEIQESKEMSNRANREGYASIYPGYSHMCGHDAHIVTGLLLARYLSEHREAIRGRISLIFQPNEEALAGARAMIRRGVTDGVDYLIGGHVAANLWKVGQIGLNVKNILAVVRSKVRMKGVPAHSTGRPDLGKNALLGACTAVTNLHAIARHGEGVGILNVGKIEGGISWNVIPDDVTIWLETRAETTEINNYMQRRAQEIIKGAAAMFDLSYTIEKVVESVSCKNSPELVAMGTEAARLVPGIEEVVPEVSVNASEDFALLAEAVGKKGGKTLYAIHGTPVAGGQHSDSFDLDERVILNAARFYAVLYDRLTASGADNRYEGARSARHWVR